MTELFKCSVLCMTSMQLACPWTPLRSPWLAVWLTWEPIERVCVGCKWAWLMCVISSSLSFVLRRKRGRFACLKAQERAQIYRNDTECSVLPKKNKSIQLLSAISLNDMWRNCSCIVKYFKRPKHRLVTYKSKTETEALKIGSRDTFV